MLRPSRLPLSVLVLALTALAAAAAGRPASGVASPWQENPQSRVRLITPYAVAPGGGEIWLGLQFTVIPDWHLYWKNSGDAGFAPTIDLDATPEVGAAELLFPAPERYELPGDLVAFGYSDEVVYPIRAQIAPGGQETVRIRVRVDYLVCEIDCIPYSYELEVEQPVAAQPVPDPETAAVLAVWRTRLPRPVAEVAGVSTDARLELADPQRPILLVRLEGVRPAGGVATELFLETHELFDADRPLREETPTGLFYRVPLVAKQVLDEAPKRSAFAWTVTGLTLAETGADAERAPPRAATPPPESPSPETSHFAIEAQRMVSGVIPDEQEGAVATRPGGGLGIAALVARALGGGLFLAFTPGALAVWLLVVGGCRRATAQGSDGEARGLGLAGAAAAGGVATAVLLAAAALARGGGWTRPLAEPPTLVLLALASLLLALGAWGLVRRGGSGEGAATARALTLPAALGAGALGTVLTLPWPLPPGPGALDAALARGPLAGIAAALALGVGLSLPLLAAALLDHRGEGALPEESSGSGRQALGFLAAGNVLWIVYLLSSRLRSENLAFVELALLAVALGVWLRRRSERPAARGAFVLLALGAAALAVVLAMR